MVDSKGNRADPRAPGAKSESSDSWKIWTPLLALTAAGFLLAGRFVGAPPPRQLRIATGSASGAYHAFGQHFASELQRSGIELEIVATAGSLENLDLLEAGEVDLALVQAGAVEARTADRDDDEAPVSAGGGG